MNFKITKDKHISLKRYVWHKGVCIGYFKSHIREREGIDWAKYRADKTLRLSSKDRWYSEYFPTAYPNTSCGKCASEKEAVLAILAKHNEAYAELEDYKEITIGIQDE